MPTTLVVVASEREGLGLIQAFDLHRDPSFKVAAGSHEQRLGLYRGLRCDLLISGVLEHHMVAATALYLRCYSADRIVNFGACGTYGTQFGAQNPPQVGDVVGVSTSLRFDVDDNQHWVPPRKIETCDIDLRHVICATGSRYSKLSDYEADGFPKEAQVEDMELYALAVLSEALEVPLYSIKYVTNKVGPSGKEQYRRNVVAAREDGYTKVDTLLDARDQSLWSRSVAN